MLTDVHLPSSDYKFGDITKRVIRDMTGNKDYEIGDGTKALSKASQEAAEKANRAGSQPCPTCPSP